MCEFLEEKNREAAAAKAEELKRKHRIEKFPTRQINEREKQK